MRYFKWILGAAVVIAVLFFLSQKFTAVFAVSQEKLNICHLTNSQNNPWVAQQINANELQSHLDNGDFLYGGPLKQNGHPENANHQADNWCRDNAPHHFTCNQDNACARVEGKGESTCETNNDCKPQSHTACVDNACVFVEGAGENQCNIESETDCKPAPTHSVCQSNACVVVEGAGNSTCKVDADCTQVVDVCPNLEGNQAEIPAGYHFETVGEVRTCVQDPQTPSNTSTNNGGSVSTPTCTDGNTVNLPANPHVIRKGSEATVNFFITQGDSANIYYKEVGEDHWTHSVLAEEVKKYINGDKFASVPVGNLNPNVGYIFAIQQVQGCGGGQLVNAVIVDGPNSQTFGFSYWEWSK